MQIILTSFDLTFIILAFLVLTSGVLNTSIYFMLEIGIRISNKFRSYFWKLLMNKWLYFPFKVFYPQPHGLLENIYTLVAW